MPGYTPPSVPNDPPAQIIQSTETNPISNMLQARKERDGSWTVTATTKTGEINRIVIPSPQVGGCIVDFRSLKLSEETQSARLSCSAGEFDIHRVR